ncbi:hypothetical protein EYV94_20550 [Puteibacter caeruleilacunae]|nr:hypothetical protein EYV94_20550 [Puteibacter caeruleilacunae]
MNNIEITKDFKLSIFKVILAIAFFFISYLVLIAVSIGLLIACGFAAFYLVTAKVNLYTLGAAAGLVTLGIMFFIFLIKFIFSKHTDSNPYRIQIYQQDHPELFKMIKEVSDAVGTQYPKKVYLRHDVNASVFYNSSFWSLFFPVKKNLDLGLGLINSVNQSELKAILAHEFGHFSQKSMALGSYVYTVNNVIHNLVYNHDRWDRMLEQWANAGGIFGIFALITSKLVQLVRFVLRKSHNVILLPYMSLSREMEFHADEIAASVAGKDNMISGLRRIEFCNMAFINTINNLRHIASKNLLSENIYLNHQHEIQTLGEHYNLQFENGLPIISNNDLEAHTVKQRVNFKDQWATHPPREDREQRISSIDESNIDMNNNSCWSLLNNAQKCQKELTINLYAVDYPDNDEFKSIDNQHYIDYTNSQQSQYSIDDYFNEFYNNRLLATVDLETIRQSSFEGNLTEELTQLYSKKSKLLFDKFQHDSNDLAVLNQIANKEIDTKYFEFDNVRYHRRDTNKAIQQLEREIKTLKEELKTLEGKAISINATVAAHISAEAREQLISKYEIIFQTQNLAEKHQEFTDMINGFQYAIYNTQSWEDDQFKQFLHDLSKFEQTYRTNITDLHLDKLKSISEKHLETLDNFINNGTSFTKLSSFDIKSFNEFVGLIFANHDLIYENFAIQLKEVTDQQIANYKQLEVLAVN